MVLQRYKMLLRLYFVDQVKTKIQNKIILNDEEKELNSQQYIDDNIVITNAYHNYFYQCFMSDNS